MGPTSDGFLLTIAEIAAGLVGLFLVGMIFYIQSGYEHHVRSRRVVEPYFRAATAITFVLLAIPLGVSLTMVALPIVWSRALFLVLAVMLVVTNVTSVSTLRAMVRQTGLGLPVVMEVVGTAGVALIVILPLATGGLTPGREDLVPPVLLSLGVAFLSICVLVLLLFDIARFERSDLPTPPLRRAMNTLSRRRHRGRERPGDKDGEVVDGES